MLEKKERKSSDVIASEVPGFEQKLGESPGEGRG